MATWKPSPNFLPDSTIVGTNKDIDTHQFTGSVLVTGSLTLNGSPVGGGGGGTITDGANVGSGGEVFKQASGADLQFRTLVGSGVTINETTNTIELTASGGGGGTPGGSDTYIQFNNNGSFSGSSVLTTDGTGSLTSSFLKVSASSYAAPPGFSGQTLTTTIMELGGVLNDIGSTPYLIYGKIARADAFGATMNTTTLVLGSSSYAPGGMDQGQIIIGQENVPTTVEGDLTVDGDIALNGASFSSTQNTSSAPMKFLDEIKVTTPLGITMDGSYPIIFGTAHGGADGTETIKRGASGAGQLILSASNDIVLSASSNVIVDNNLSASLNISASAFYGDGSTLSNVGGSPGGATAEIQYNNGASFAGAGGVEFNKSYSDGYSTSNGNLRITGSSGKPQLELGYFDPTFTGGTSGYLWLIDSMGSTTASLFTGDGMLGQYSGLHLSSSNNVVVDLGDAVGNNKFRIFRDGDNGSAAAEVANIDSVGRCTLSTVTASLCVSASAFYGDGSTLSGLSTAAISSYTNPANDRVVTSVNATTVNSEQYLTFDGNTLSAINNNSTPSLVLGDVYDGGQMGSGEIWLRQGNMNAGVNKIYSNQNTLHLNLSSSGDVVVNNGLSASFMSSDYSSASISTATNASCSIYNVFNYQLGASLTLTALNPVAGASYLFFFRQDSSGGRVVTFSGFKWPGGTAPTLSTASLAVDIVSGISDGTYIYADTTKEFR